MRTPKECGRGAPGRWLGAGLAVLFGAAAPRAQTITHLAYAFDMDPGPGGGTQLAVVPDAEATWTGDLQAPASPGLHRLYLRTRDEDGRWSPAEMRLLQVRGTEAPFQPQVVGAECSLDTPAAPGAGTPLPLAAGPEPTLAASLPVASLGEGLHRVFLRVQDEAGRWSGAEMRLFRTSPGWTPEPLPRITAAEAFVDSDPGAGNGTALDLAAGPDVTLLDALDSAPLAGGLHMAGLRVRDNLGRWSQVEKRPFLLRPEEPPTVQPQVVAAEVFVDSDPGPGHGMPLTVGPGMEVELAEGVDVTTLDPGLHTMHLRVRDEHGRWSQREARPFFLHGSIDPGGGQRLAAAEYFINQDPGPGFGVPVPLPLDGNWDGTQETVAASVDGVPVGRHWLGLRFRDNGGAWSSTVADSFLVGPLLAIQTATLPASLTWEGDLEGDVVHVYRATSIAGPWTWVHSTTEAGWIDPEDPAAPARRWYRVTQEAGPLLAPFRLPEPSGPGATPNRRAKRAGEPPRSAGPRP